MRATGRPEVDVVGLQLERVAVQVDVRAAASLSALRRGQGGVTTSGTATLLDGLLFPLCLAAELIVDVSMLVVLLSPIGRWVTTNTTEGNTLGSSRTAG